MLHDEELRGFAQRVRARCLGPEPSTDARDIYGRLILERTISAVEATLPRTARLVGRANVAAWSALFLAREGSRSPYFRHVSGELVRWCIDQGFFDDGPASWKDAARFELACFEVNISPLDEPAAALPLALDRPVRLTRAHALLGCDHGVHLDLEHPPEGRVELLIHRDHETRRVVHRELSTAAACVLRRLAATLTLRRGIEEGLEEAAAPCSDAVLGEIAHLLADLAERRVVLGAALDASADGFAHARSP